MNDAQLANLKSRWNTESSRIGMHFLSGSQAPPFPNLPNGLIDLRGIAISEVIKNATFCKVDFSGSSIVGFGQFAFCRMRYCCFSKSELTTNLGSLFEDCDFTGSNLAGAILRGKFIDCDFNSAILTSARGGSVEFNRCVFKKTNFRKAELTHCLFQECQFEECKFGSGSLSYSKFVRSTLNLQTLGNTLLEKVVTS